MNHDTQRNVQEGRDGIHAGETRSHKEESGKSQSSIEAKTGERWARVDGWPKYEVSTVGNVRRDGHKITTFPVRGYFAFNVIDGPRRKSLRVHRQILIAFVGPSHLQGRHKDGNKANNTIGNLLYGTQKENEADKVLHGTAIRGERSPQAKLTAAQAAEIRSSKEKGTVLAARYNVTSTLVCAIRKGRAWAFDLEITK